MGYIRVRVRVEGFRVISNPSVSSRERVKVSHVMIECTVIYLNPYPYLVSRRALRARQGPQGGASLPLSLF